MSRTHNYAIRLTPEIRALIEEAARRRIEPTSVFVRRALILAARAELGVEG